MSQGAAQARRRVLQQLLFGWFLGVGLLQSARASPEPWTVDRWAGRPRRIAKPRPDQPQPSRARGGLVEQVHVDPLPDLPAVDHFEGRPPASISPPAVSPPAVSPPAVSPREKRAARARKKAKGQGTIELLLAAPVLLFAGLVILQVFLLMQARQALRLGALEAGRAASVAHADPQAALQGLAQGLAPWWAGASQTQDALTAPLRTRVHLVQAMSQGRLRITQLAPDEAAFTDWAVPATDDAGRIIGGQREIPNDALRIRSTETQPQTAVSGAQEGQPKGVQSGQTLLQANILRLQIDYVVALRVPLAGQAIAVLARAWQSDPMLRQMSSNQGLPVRVKIAIRMQTPARFVGSGAG